MSYVQGFVVPVPTANKEAYRAMAEMAADVFKEHGATGVMEAWGDNVPDGKVTDFRRAVAATADEAIVFSWVIWPDRETCEAAEPKVMADPRMNAGQPMPFDGKRMIWGGFVPIVEA